MHGGAVYGQAALPATAGVVVTLLLLLLPRDLASPASPTLARARTEKRRSASWSRLPYPPLLGTVIRARQPEPASGALPPLV